MGEYDMPQIIWNSYVTNENTEFFKIIYSGQYRILCFSVPFITMFFLILPTHHYLKHTHVFRFDSFTTAFHPPLIQISLLLYGWTLTTTVAHRSLVERPSNPWTVRTTVYTLMLGNSFSDFDMNSCNHWDSVLFHFLWLQESYYITNI